MCDGNVGNDGGETSEEHRKSMAMAGTEQGLTVKIRGNGDPAKLDPTALAGAWFASIQVPANLVDKYKAADVWSTKADYIRPLED